MAIGEITEKYFLSPREAVDLHVGPATNENWSFADPEQRQVALRVLYKALHSGSVPAHYSAFDGNQRTLTPGQAAGEFFRIDLEQDCCLFGPIVGPPNELKIGAKELVTFLRKHTPAHRPGSSRAKYECKTMLTAIMQSEEKPTKESIWLVAKDRFGGLSRNGFDDAWSAAIDASGRTDLRKGGAPKGPRMTRVDANKTGAPK